MPSDRPNVLIVFSDQHRASALNCAGDPNVDTPNMDRFASDGTRFTNYYANDPLCTPSRGCILTGQYPGTHGAFNNEMRLFEDAPSIAEIFNEAGYRTGYVGKWHLDGTNREWIPPGPRRQGFDDFWAVNHSDHDYIDGTYFGDGPEPVQTDGYLPRTETDLAMEFMSRDDDRPFCLVLAWGPPHAPYEDVPDEYKMRYDPDELDLRPNVEAIPGDTTYYNWPKGADQESVIRETTRDYYAQITALDAQFGRLIDYLEESEMASDTLTVYTSDHGDMLWSQGAEKKTAPWEEAANVPLMVRWPDEVPEGRVNDALLSTVDLAPTVLSLAGQSPDPEMQGADRAGLVRGNVDERADSVYLMRCATPGSRDEWRGVRTERYTYAQLLDGTPWLLYETESDPYQQTNLVSDPEYADVQEELAAEIDAWSERVDDPQLRGEELALEQGRMEELYAAVGYVTRYWGQ